MTRKMIKASSRRKAIEPPTTPAIKAVLSVEEGGVDVMMGKVVDVLIEVVDEGAMKDVEAAVVVESAVVVVVVVVATVVMVDVVVVVVVVKQSFAAEQEHLKIMDAVQFTHVLPKPLQEKVRDGLAPPQDLTKR